MTVERDPRAEPAGPDPLRRAIERLRARAPRCDPRHLRPGHSRPRDLLRHAARLRGPGRQGRIRARLESSAGLVCRVLDRDTTTSSPACPRKPNVWMSHGDQVHDVEAEFVPLAATDTCPVAAVRHRDRPVFGLQFHPEVTHTPYGSPILGNFLDRVCRCKGTWKMGDFVEQTVAEIQRAGRPDRPRDLRPLGRRRFGRRGRPARPGASGRRSPASSSITACCGRAKRAAVVETFSRHFKTDLHVVDAADRFLEALAGVTDPQEKRMPHRPRLHRRASRTRRDRSTAPSFSPRARSTPT